MPENVGTVRQPLVGGQLVDLKTQEDFGLLTLGRPGDNCTASLIRNKWAIAAAHCLEVKDANGQFIPDPDNPGQNTLVPVDRIRVRANWRGGQVRNAVRVFTFRPLDIALIELFEAVDVHGFTNTFSRDIFQSTPEGMVPQKLTLFGRGISQFASGSGPTATPSVQDGQHRLAYANTTQADDNLIWYGPLAGAFIAGGDSGGPSFVWEGGQYKLMGVHALTTVTCVVGQTCGDWVGPGPVPAGYGPWNWVTSTPRAADAPIGPVRGKIFDIIGPSPGPDDYPQLAPGYIGVFSESPPNYRPLLLYGIDLDGSLEWRRKETGMVPWAGPETVGRGWTDFAQVIPAGGHRLYALTNDGKLLWYQHDGANDGSFEWAPAVEVGHGWSFVKIFGGGDGVIYAIDGDGKLFWYRHYGFRDGSDNWAEWKEIGRGWDQFVSVCSGGGGTIYAVKSDGTLVLYTHRGFADGRESWTPPRLIGIETTTGKRWADFKQIVALGDGVLLAIQEDGQVLWYKHLGRVPTKQKPDEVLVEREVEVWEGPLTIGSGFYYKSAFTLLPENSTQGPR